MTTVTDWARDILAAAEERGWTVVLLDARAGLVALEEPMGSGSLTLRISGGGLTGDFIRRLPEAQAWQSPSAEGS